jgi:hypothetical protein
MFACCLQCACLQCSVFWRLNSNVYSGSGYDWWFLYSGAYSTSTSCSSGISPPYVASNGNIVFQTSGALRR